MLRMTYSKSSNTACALFKIQQERAPKKKVREWSDVGVCDFIIFGSGFGALGVFAHACSAFCVAGDSGD